MKTLGSILTKNMYFVKEHLGLLQATNNYDIFDPDKDELVFECREEPLDVFNATLRLARFSTLTPFHIHISNRKGEKLISIRRHPDFLKSDIGILNSEGDILWIIKETSLPHFKNGEALTITHEQDKNHYVVFREGKTYMLTEHNREIGSVVKDWEQLPKEIFKTTDTYTIYIESNIPDDSPLRILLMALSVCIDMLYYDGIEL